MQGTNSSKKKKKNKLKRVMQTVKKYERRAADKHQEAFAAMQLLHDPQACLLLIPSKVLCTRHHEAFAAIQLLHDPNARPPYTQALIDKP